jgi:hypothetical protein
LQSRPAKAHHAESVNRALLEIVKEETGGSKEAEGQQGQQPVNGYGTAAMTFILHKAHFIDRRILARLNTAVFFGPVLSGLAACMLGAIVYDIGRWFSIW